jgi:hypothetical protein
MENAPVFRRHPIVCSKILEEIFAPKAPEKLCFPLAAREQAIFCRVLSPDCRFIA